MTTRGSAISALLAAVLASSMSLAATPQQAGELYKAGDWAQAEKAYRELTEETPGNAIYKYRLAVTLRKQGKLQAAQMWLEEARGGVVPDSYIEVERARLLTEKGENNNALRALEEAARQGFPNQPDLRGDSALEDLVGDPRFEEIIRQMDKNRVPCEHIPEFSQFDFWVGDWRVLDPNGTLQGTNRIEKIEGGCLLLEHWNSAGGSTGTSMNFYDLRAGEWVQIWVSPGLQLEIRGGLVDGSMVLTGHIYYVQSGDQKPFRGTWTPLDDGVVRQHFEESSDGGETWVTWFDGYYHPSEPSAGNAD